jgi:diphthamide synthase (EF-2-diphthine--ammonia ligase)
MTTTSVTSRELTGNGFKKRRDNYRFSQNIYQVEVNGEDGEYQQYEIMADSSAQATEIAEQLASDSMVDISYIQITIIG